MVKAHQLSDLRRQELLAYLEEGTRLVERVLVSAQKNDWPVKDLGYAAAKHIHLQALRDLFAHITFLENGNPLTREALEHLRKCAVRRASVKGLNPEWKAALLQFADNAHALDVMITQTEVSVEAVAPDIK